MKKTLSLISMSIFLAGCSSAPKDMDDAAEPKDDVVMEDSMENDDTMMDDTTGFTGETTTVNYERSKMVFVGGSSIIDHDGGFKTFTFDLNLDATEPSNLEKATVSSVIEIDSVFTDSEGLNGHLLKEDFFDAENYPQATFESTSIVSAGGDMYEIAGDLTMKGTTKSIVLDSTITDAAAIVEFEIPRKEFNIGNDSYGDKLLDEYVPVTATIIFE